MSMREIDLPWMTWRAARDAETEGGAQGSGGDTGSAGDDSGQGSGDGQSAETTRPVLGGGTADSEANADGDGKSNGDKDGGESSDEQGGQGESDAGSDGKSDEVPESYDFSNIELPEGMGLDTALAEGLGDTMKELGITQSQAEKLATAYAGVVQEQHKAAVEEHSKTVKGWADEARKDKELGADWSQTVSTANKALDKFGTDALKEFLSPDQTGLGEHPELIRAFYRAGLAVADDAAVRGNETSGDDTPPEQRWYAETTPANKKG